MINKVQCAIYKISLVALLIFCSLGISASTKNMKNYLHKNLEVKVGDSFEEVPVDQPCVGGEIYLIIVFDEQRVTILEKEVSTCGDSFVEKIGRYKWALLSNNKIEVDFVFEEIKGSYAENIIFELREGDIIGIIRHLDGKVIEYRFKELS